jgi:hypothetical protein
MIFCTLQYVGKFLNIIRNAKMMIIIFGQREREREFEGFTKVRRTRHSLRNLLKFAELGTV